MAAPAHAQSPERERELARDWWLRTLLVLIQPRISFAALRDDSDDAANARQEPMLAVLWLGGIAGVLAANVSARLFDDYEITGVLVPVWAFIAGGIHGAAVYFVVGAAVYLGADLAGSLGSYRRARHLLGLAAVPLALALFAIWPLRLAIYGGDLFRSGGSDTGTGNRVFEGLELGFLGWSLALLLLGLKVVHDWPWPRALAAWCVPAILPGLALLRAYGVI